MNIWYNIYVKRTRERQRWISKCTTQRALNVEYYCVNQSKKILKTFKIPLDKSK